MQGEAAIFQACKNSYASAAPSALLCSSVSTRPAFASQPAAGRSPAMSGRWGSLSLLVDSSGEPIRKTDGRRSERRTGLAVTGPTGRLDNAGFRYEPQQYPTQQCAGMDLVKNAIWGPDPKEQYRKCLQSLRKNKRQLDRQIQDLNNVEKKSKSLIKQAAKKNDMKSARLYAKELRNTQKVNERMHVSRATLDSIELKLNEQQQLIKIKGSLQKSTAIMQDMSQLVRVPQISKAVQELSKELMKSGVIDEMVSDMLDSAEWEDEELDENEEIDDLLTDILGDKETAIVQEPSTPAAVQQDAQKAELAAAIEADDDDDEDLIQNMRQRLSALQG